MILRQLSKTPHDSQVEMALKSKFPDLEIPENVSWPDFVLQNFDQYGEKTAIVSTNEHIV